MYNPPIAVNVTASNANRLTGNQPNGDRDMSTTILPVDKHGNVYYGPKTYSDAEYAIDTDGRDPFAVARMMSDAGYTGVAARIRRDYGPRSMIKGVTVQHDASGQGHCWRLIDLTDDMLVDVRDEIETEIMTGNAQCDDYVACNGQHYRWS